MFELYAITRYSFEYKNRIKIITAYKLVYVCKVTPVFLLHEERSSTKWIRIKLKLQSNRSHVNYPYNPNHVIHNTLLFKIKLKIFKSTFYPTLLFLDYVHYPFSIINEWSKIEKLIVIGAKLINRCHVLR